MNVFLLLVASLAVSWASPCGHSTTENAPTESIPVTTTQQTPTVWPLGSYSLPKPTAGCPGSEWLEGAFYQDTEDYYNGNSWNMSHLDGAQKQDGFLSTFCTMADTTNSVAGSWAAGSYCILKKNTCPAGFAMGSILWDDENNYNMNYIVSDLASLPDGIYDQDTKMEFCCREDGEPASDILLPTADPFYLLAKTDVCQNVAGMSVMVETMKWDDEDSSNHNAREGSTPFNAGNTYNVGMHFCYYTPL